MPTKISIINGPNLNLLGKREPEIYGDTSFESYFEVLKAKFPELDFDYFQSNHEGEIIDQLQTVGFNCDGIILNAAGYTHTSIAIMDAIKAISCPVVEVHISDVSKREEFRQHSYVSMAAAHSIVGLGLEGYRKAVEWILEK